MCKSITEITGLGIIGTGIIGIITGIEIIGDINGALIKGFMEIMYINLISMDITETTYIMGSITVRITMCRFTETVGMPDTTITDMLGIIITGREKPTTEELPHTTVEDQIDTPKEMPPLLTVGLGQLTETTTIRVQQAQGGLEAILKRMSQRTIGANQIQ